MAKRATSVGRDAPGIGARVRRVFPAAKRKAGTLKRKAAVKATASSFSHGIVLGGARRSKRTSAPRRQTPSRDGHTASPFPGLARPTPGEVTKLHAALAKLFGERRPAKRGRKREILDTVVGTILSQNTTNVNSHRAFQQLKELFPTWEEVRVATPAKVAAAIKCGGLAPKKTKWIQHILRTVHRERGEASLEYLRRVSKSEVHEDLERFVGIGKKTAAIINLFDVGHPDMAVDTHVFRYAVQLSWAPTDAERAVHNEKVARSERWPQVTRDSVYAHLDAVFPDWLKYSMHLLLTDTVGGLPVVCGAGNQLAFERGKVLVDGAALGPRCLEQK